MPVYTASNGAIVADLTALRAIVSTDLPASGFVVLFVAAENSWFEYNPTLTSGDATPVNDPTNGRWIRIGRDKLTANRTYFVRTDGSDANNGLANTSGGAFLTIQKAINVAANVDLNGFILKVKVGIGTYTLPITLKEVAGYSGSGCLILEGDTTTPSNVIISTTSANCIFAKNINSIWDIQGVKLQTTTGGSAIRVENASLRYGAIDFGACAIGHIILDTAAKCECISNYVITGSTLYHWFVNSNSVLLCADKTITLTGTPNFGVVFIRSSLGGAANIPVNTFVGAATGVRYSALSNSAIDVAGAGASYLPGNSAGSTDSTGVYQ